MNVFTRILVTLTFIASASLANAGTESDWSGPAEPKREIASESLEDTLRSWDRADYASNMTEEERVEREVIEAEGPVKPAKRANLKKPVKATKKIAKKTASKQIASKKIAKKNPKRLKTSKKVALNSTKKLRR